MRRHNILFVFADQWRAQAFGYMGDPNVQTPNMDRFAAESVSFDNAVSGCPVCTPYRASLMTGVYPHRHKLMVNDQCLYERYEGPFLAECLHGERYTYVRSIEGPWRLYDNQADPLQLSNLVDSPEHAAKVERLDAELTFRLEVVGDGFEPGGEIVAREGYALGRRGDIAIVPSELPEPY